MFDVVFPAGPKFCKVYRVSEKWSILGVAMEYDY